MSAQQPSLHTVQQSPNSESAVVFVHGFGGDITRTWQKFPSLLKDDVALSEWDIYCLGYRTGLSLDVVRVWTADPELKILAQFLSTHAGLSPLNRYKSLTLIAHSMGGLVVQRALLSDAPLQLRTRFVFLFGTPSNGLAKAAWFRFWKPQIDDMAEGSSFLTQLRKDWSTQFATNKPFKFWTVAGDADQFVPPQSSLEPFPSAEQFVISGNHLSIVKPDSASHLGVELVKKGLMGNAAVAGPWNSARVAAELSDFQRVMKDLGPLKDELDESGMATLALAMEETGRSHADVIKYLEESLPKDKEYTDVMGILAGRYKRRWLAEHRAADYDRAFKLYQQAYEISVGKKNPAQAFYHGINLAFLSLAQNGDRAAAKKIAEEVLAHCEAAHAIELPTKPDAWRLATEGEAHLYLGNMSRAMEAYRAAVATRPTPRQLDSMYQQAFFVVARFLGDEKAALLLEQIFRGGA